MSSSSNTTRAGGAAAAPSHDLSQYITLQGGQAQIVLPPGLVPGFIVQALQAVKGGHTDQARALLQVNRLPAVEAWAEENPSARDVTYCIVGMILHKLGQPAQAVQWYEKVRAHQAHTLVLQELARLHRRLGELDLAVACAQQAIEMEPHSIELGNQLATDLMYEGHLAQGISLLRGLIALCPSDPRLHSNLLFLLHHLPGVSTETLWQAHQQWGSTHTPIHLAKTDHANDPNPDRPLRIGYLSSDFRRHSVTYTFEALLDGRSAGQAELYAYASVAQPDEVTHRLSRKFDAYRDICACDDPAVAQMIEEDRIDILVAVAGHTRDHRLTVLGYKPAPIQVNFGWVNTLGIDQVDCLLTDELLTPPETQARYKERFVFLPGSSLCYAPPAAAPEVGSLPAERNGFVTFGCFNKRLKINHQVISLWARILHAVRGSRMVLKFRRAEDEAVRASIRDRFTHEGIGADRIDIRGYQPCQAHFQLYSEIDIALDTFPFNGCVTTLESLWMGVPVISLTGEKIVSRIGLTLLQRVGLAYFAAAAPDAYVKKAIALARNPGALARIRASLRTRMMSSSLVDAKRFADELERGYRAMWRRWCNLRSPEQVTGIHA